MKAKGFNGREYVWNLSKYDVYNNDTKRRSKHHLRARKIIKEIYSSYRILEEVKLPGSTASHRRSVLYLDFFIPNLMLGVEVHGRQHYEHIPFFHKTKRDFLLAKARDEDKADWCELNGIELITLKYSDTDDEWRNAIKSG
ncbi:MAG: hypothetical protein FI729_02990 [SAR202 cluster bacterium]|nr:hypothetical protein [SAR202 cluster bacterium]